MPNGFERNRPHIVLPDHGEREDFTSPFGGGGNMDLPQRDRHRHSAKLRNDIARAVAAADAQLAGRDPQLSAGQPGFYLEFEIPSAQAATADKLENKQGGFPIELVAVRPAPEDPQGHVIATVYVPAQRKGFYEGKVEAYENEDQVNYARGPDRQFLTDAEGNRIEKSRRPKNEALVASLDAVRLGTLQSLFTDPGDLPAAGQDVWWEIWLRAESRPAFEHAATRLNVAVREHTVRFAEREVVLARTSRETLTQLIVHTNAVAEVRLNRDTPAAFMDMEPTAQREWVDDVLDRLAPPPGDAPAVCILDSGCMRTHPLIEPTLAAADHQAWRVDWTPNDDGQWRGHGTQMSGLALYGDLTPVLIANGPIAPVHRLESVKILPDRGQNDPDLYGYVMASAISVAEIRAPERARVFCMAVTADGDHWRGRPSSWSAKVDDLAYGEGADQRLIAISAGNIRDNYPAAAYLDQNDASGVLSPAQAWNALTVGAVTERCNITNVTYAGWTAMAPAGDLSPCSRTSITFNDDWPIKPEVVFEGGNNGVNPATGIGDHVDDLALLSTFHRPNEGLLTVAGNTSAATALVSRMGAQILADNRTAWPETVRGLIVHSARWTDAMRGHLPANPNQSHKRLLVRRYGYGVPDLDRARRSASNDVTLISEREMQPFQVANGKVKTRDMMLHSFPWPQAELEALGDADVRMRVTLSYFIEPNPGERGWTQKHKYASHGLRFSVKRAEESMAAFRRRINKAARDEEETGDLGGSEPGWYLGPRLRNKGSIHSDVWEGTAVDLASRHAIAVYPTGGWWRQKPSLGRADLQIRYSLIVSLEATADVDLYTPIWTIISSGVEVET
jgi:hypothetical protein